MRGIVTFAVLAFAAGGLGTAAAQALAGTQAELKPLHAHINLDLTALKEAA